VKILRDYLLGELAYIFLSTLAILTFLLVSGSVLTKMADLVINWGVDAMALVKLFILSTPFLFNFTIPMSALVAVLLVFGKMSADQELTAIKASGINLLKLINPILIAALMLMLATFLINDRIAPASHYEVRRLSAEIGMKSPASVLEEGVFIKQFKNLVIYIHKIRQNELSGIRIYQPQDKGPTRTIVAEKGELISIPEQNVIKLKLMNGMTDEPDPKDPQKFYKARFSTYTIPLDISEFNYRTPLVKKPKEMSLKELRDELRRLNEEHQFFSVELLAEIHRKIAMSLAVFVFALFGIPLGILTRRGEKSIGLAIALLFSVIYWSLLMGGSALAKSGVVPALICMQFPNALFLAIAIMLLRRVSGPR